ncbi:MAG: hypothetical protein EB127_00590 [Alphaproteobacteria bacterium]|nr:hypothetical protein [Alphaproteobacteria bacterium]
MIKINSILSDEEIENCIDGSSSIKLIRQIIENTQEDNMIDVDDFADTFATELEDFIGEYEDTEEWKEAWDNNWEWGLSIAEAINDLLVDKWTKM